ncbi:MAG: D-aminoacyl-tRNA deacylase [Gemmatimonadota bacterium]
MRTVVQRVRSASVRVDGRVVGEIGPGLLVLAGFAETDGDETLAWMADKLLTLRIFAGPEGRMDLDVAQVGGEVLVVSQFTLYGDVSRGRRPSFTRAAPPEVARDLYGRFLDRCRSGTVPIASGEFGAVMSVRLENDGPVTLVIDR